MENKEKKIIGTIYWIDDNIEQMLYVVQGVFTQLWDLKNEDGVKSKIVIFGNGCEEYDSNDLCSMEIEQKYTLRLWNMFVDKCQDVDGARRGNETFGRNEELIQEPIRFLFKKGNEEEEDFYKSIKNLWIHGNLNADSKDYQSVKDKTTQLLEKIKIDEDSCVAVDLVIFFDDLDRVINGKRIFSMEMYNQLVERGNKCFIYSSDADQEEVIAQWKNTYRELYNQDAEVEIYQRIQLTEEGRHNMAEVIKGQFVNKEK